MIADTYKRELDAQMKKSLYIPYQKKFDKRFYFLKIFMLSIFRPRTFVKGFKIKKTDGGGGYNGYRVWIFKRTFFIGRRPFKYFNQPS